MKNRDLTQRELDTLLAFTLLHDEHGKRPTLASLAAASGVSIATVRERLENLIDLGAMESEGYGAGRVMTITDAGLKALGAP